MNYETQGSILAEMRELAESQYDAWLNDPNSAPDGRCWSERLNTLADRIKAAAEWEKIDAVTIAAGHAVKLTNEKWRRDTGNATALREALEGVLSALADAGFHPYVYGDPLAEAVIKARAALAAPPRNCDKYADEDDAFAAWHDSLKDGDIVSVRNALRWLFSTEGKEASNG